MEQVVSQEPVEDKSVLPQKLLEENLPNLLEGFFAALKEGITRREKVAMDIVAQMAGYSKGKGNISVNTFVNATAPQQGGTRPRSFEDIALAVQQGQQRAQLEAAELPIAEAEFVDVETEKDPWER